MKSTAFLWAGPSPRERHGMILKGSFRVTEHVVLLPGDSITLEKGFPPAGTPCVIWDGEYGLLKRYEPLEDDPKEVHVIREINIGVRYEDLYSSRNDGDRDLWTARDRERAEVTKWEMRAKRKEMLKRQKA